MNKQSQQISALRVPQIQKQREPLSDRKRADLHPQPLQVLSPLDRRRVADLGIRYLLICAWAILGVRDLNDLLNSAQARQDAYQIIEFAWSAELMKQRGQQRVGLRTQLAFGLIDQPGIVLNTPEPIGSCRRRLLELPFRKPAQPSVSALPQAKNLALRQNVAQLVLKAVTLGIFLSQVPAASVECGNGYVTGEIRWRLLFRAGFESINRLSNWSIVSLQTSSASSISRRPLWRERSIPSLEPTIFLTTG